VDLGESEITNTVSGKRGCQLVLFPSTMAAKNRKFDVTYIKYRFTYIKKYAVQLPQCVLSLKTQSNHAMRPTRLQRHLTRNYPAVKNRKGVFLGKV
jgi:hypothetical protein